jgi:hypothetical protein
MERWEDEVEAYAKNPSIHSKYPQWISYVLGTAPGTTDLDEKHKNVPTP